MAKNMNDLDGIPIIRKQIIKFFCHHLLSIYLKKKHQRLIIGTERSVVIQFATLWLAEINLTAEQLETRL